MTSNGCKFFISSNITDIDYSSQSRLVKTEFLKSHITIDNYEN